MMHRAYTADRRKPLNPPCLWIKVFIDLKHGTTARISILWTTRSLWLAAIPWHWKWLVDDYSAPNSGTGCRSQKRGRKRFIGLINKRPKMSSTVLAMMFSRAVGRGPWYHWCFPRIHHSMSLWSWFENSWKFADMAANSRASWCFGKVSIPGSFSWARMEKKMQYPTFLGPIYMLDLTWEWFTDWAIGNIVSLRM